MKFRDKTKSWVRRALLVEDDPHLLQVWKVIFLKLDVEIELQWVTGVRAARKKLNEERAPFFELVICDIFLSGGSTGIDLYHEFSRPGLPFLFSSAVSEAKFPSLFRQGDEVPFFLPKPIDIARCIPVINELLAKSASPAQAEDDGKADGKADAAADAAADVQVRGVEL